MLKKKIQKPSHSLFFLFGRASTVVRTTWVGLFTGPYIVLVGVSPSLSRFPAVKWGGPQTPKGVVSGLEVRSVSAARLQDSAREHGDRQFRRLRSAPSVVAAAERCDCNRVSRGFVAVCLNARFRFLQ